MSLILRTQKGSPLTYLEGDENLLYLESLAGSGGIGIVEVTKSELDLLISNNELSVGSIYKISGIDGNLYDGNTIGWFSAITENKLDSDGIGMFYTPKYDKSTRGFGIVEDYNWWYNDINGEIGRLNLHNNIQSQTIWGGYLWKTDSYIDVNAVDYILNDLELDPSYFEKIPYNDNDYNIHYDKIKYEYDSDIIYSRTDGNNTVNCVPLLIQFGGPSEDGKNPIEYFQWGNLVDANQRGNGLIYVENSLFNNINFRGAVQAFINFKNNSVQDYTNFSNYSTQVNISFDKSKQQYMYFDRGNQENITFINSDQIYIEVIHSHQEVFYFINSEQENVTLDNGYQEEFKLFNSTQTLISAKGAGQRRFDFIDSRQNNISLSNDSYQECLTFDNESYQENLIFNNSKQEYLTFSNGSSQYNLTFDNKSNQQFLTFNNSYQGSLTFDNDSYQYNLTFDIGSYQEYLTFDGSYQQGISFNNSSYQEYLTFNKDSGQEFLTFNNASAQYRLTFSNSSRQSNLTFYNGSIQHNLTFDIDSMQQYLTFDNLQLNYNSILYTNKSIMNLRGVGSGSYISVPDLTSATNIFDNTLIKEIIVTPSGMVKMKYLDDMLTYQFVDLNS